MSTAPTAETLMAALVTAYLLAGTELANVPEADFTALREAAGVEEAEAADEGFTVQVGRDFYHLRQVELVRSRGRGGSSFRYELSVC